MARKSKPSEEDVLDRAQELIYEAWDARTAKRRIALAEKALTVSALCADAYVLLAEHAEVGSDAALDLWRRGEEAGRAALGAAAFKKDEGDFWGLLETRPFMRALFGLACTEKVRGDHAAAIDHLREMLRLNPNDNQGARHILAAVLLEAGRDDDLAALFETYPEDSAAAWSWTRPLAAFRRSGDDAQNRKLLAKAMAENPHVPAFLTGEKPIPARLSPYYTPGDANEAIEYVLDFRSGWEKTPGAIDWLRAHASAPKKAPRRKPSGRSSPE
ncbi:hypothetical protein [Xanthobacter autotrophicus]|uniref:hypothetical protein n=1 Tax=Xanthobacter autotrophicus TaxID=280 RepID=UPI0037261E2F